MWEKMHQTMLLDTDMVKTNLQVQSDILIQRCNPSIPGSLNQSHF